MGGRSRPDHTTIMYVYTTRLSNGARSVPLGLQGSGAGDTIVQKILVTRGDDLFCWLRVFSISGLTRQFWESYTFYFSMVFLKSQF